jgi:adenylate kinase family enzyme
VRQRIVIYGVTGAGKSTLGRRLARDLGIHHIELDSLFHGPNWTPTPPEAFLAKVQAEMERSPGGWVADGNYGQVRPVLLSQADTVVWLRLPWRVTYWSLVKRTFGRWRRNEELWNGNRESLRMQFLDRDSLLLFGITNYRSSVRKTRRALAELDHKAEVFEVRSRRQLEELVRRFLAERHREVAG